jgi:pimeloyl-ACP methyl ester carboxylesterase
MPRATSEKERDLIAVDERRWDTHTGRARPTLGCRSLTMHKSTGVFRQERGDGGPVALLLHGLNGTGAVWHDVDGLLAEAWPGRRILLDLPGHGASADLENYSLGAMAHAVADALVDVAEPVHVLGHSMGGAIGLALASNWFGTQIASVAAISVKTHWSEEELARAASNKSRSRKTWPSRPEAEQMFWRSVGLSPSLGWAPELLARGVVDGRGAFSLAADPRAKSTAGPWMDSVISAVRTPFVMACGSADPIVTTPDPLDGLDYEVVRIEGAAHNLHVDQPRAVANLFLEHAAALI